MSGAGTGRRPAPEGRPRLGAYVLAGDPVWLASSLARYYPFLDDLVVVASSSRRGWTGRPIPVDACLERVASVDHRGIARVVWGDWEDLQDPMRADTAQRQAGVDALGAGVDWVLQIDNDEILPDIEVLLEAIGEAAARSLEAIEWPMRVLYRRLASGTFLEVCSVGGRPSYDYPGPIAVRSGSRVVEARRTRGSTLRVTVRGDTRSLQLAQPAGAGELRLEMLDHAQAIVHNSWGRPRADIRRKIGTWGHAGGIRADVYFWTRWWPSRVTWPLLRNLHPFARDLWPRLTRTSSIQHLLLASDR